jgi:hypothetical protein
LAPGLSACSDGTPLSAARRCVRRHRLPPPGPLPPVQQRRHEQRHAARDGHARRLDDAGLPPRLSVQGDRGPGQIPSPAQSSGPRLLADQGPDRPCAERRPWSRERVGSHMRAAPPHRSVIGQGRPAPAETVGPGGGLRGRGHLHAQRRHPRDLHPRGPLDRPGGFEGRTRLTPIYRGSGSRAGRSPPSRAGSGRGRPVPAAPRGASPSAFRRRARRSPCHRVRVRRT